jgi:hypothetical protein
MLGHHIHKGYKCLDIATGRLYISRDVTFDESVYPFSHLHPNAGALLRTEIQLLPSVLRNLSILDQENELCHDHMSISANFSLDDSLQEPSVAGNYGANLENDPAANSRDSHAESASGSGPQDPPATPVSSRVCSNLRSPPGAPSASPFSGPSSHHGGSSPNDCAHDCASTASFDPELSRSTGSDPMESSPAHSRSSMPTSHVPILC